MKVSLKLSESHFEISAVEICWGNVEGLDWVSANGRTSYCYVGTYVLADHVFPEGSYIPVLDRL